MISRFLRVFALCPVVFSTFCFAEAPNPLIGHWLVELGGDVNSDGFAYCKVIPELVFAPKTETKYVDGGAHSTDDVIYLVSGSDVYVSSTPGFVGAPKFTMLGPNEMTLNAVGHCKYRRQ